MIDIKTDNRRILVAAAVDQTQLPVKYVRLLSSINYTVSSVSQSEEAIFLIKGAVADQRPFSLVFLEAAILPGLNRFQAIQEIRRIDPDIEIVLIDNSQYLSSGIILPEKRPVDKFLHFYKPLDSDEIIQLALVLTEKWGLHQMVKRKTEELRIAHAFTMRALAELAESRDGCTGNHLKRVAQYSRLIAGKLGERKEQKWCNYISRQYIEDIGESSILHDIGKVGIPDTVLLKPGKLTIEEFELMKTHTTIGGDTLAKADREIGVQSFLTLGKEIAYYHHEKFDGTGYPKGLKGEEIPLSARIVALADVYDALTSSRPYRKELSHETAFMIITEQMGGLHFDPNILEIFHFHEQEFKRIRLQHP